MVLHECRIRCKSTNSGWAWDIATLKFYSGATRVYPMHAIDSGNAGDGWGPMNAVENNDSDRCWGGRKDENGDFWIGGTFSSDVKVAAVQVKETSHNHRAIDPNGIMFEVKEDGDENEWKTVTPSGHENLDLISEQILKKKDNDSANPKVVMWEPSGPIPNDNELTCKPSQPVAGKLHGVCYKSNLHPRPSEALFPDNSFYYSENCEGLYVCVSKACGEETLQRVCRFIRGTVPEEQRKMWGEFISPTWAKDPGPMRLIVLDNRTNQQAGCIPELNDYSKGRNQTSCPFVFTSREDFYGGIGGGQTWCEGQLTLHELTHGSDMVIRQLKDPYFHDEVGKLWSKYRDKFRYKDTLQRTITILESGDHRVDEEESYSYCYAAANRDEFLAECHCIAQGLHIKCKDYMKCNMSTPREIREVMPDAYQLLKRHFLLVVP